jgi:hypothetical protein
MSKTLTIIAEKPALLINLYQRLSEENQSYFTNYDKIEVINLIGFGLYKFKYPSHTKYNSYPMIKEIEYKYNTSLVYKPRNPSKDLPELFYLLSLEELPNYIENLKEAKNDLFIITDCDYSGADSAMRFLTINYGEEWKNNFNNIYSYLFDNPFVENTNLKLQSVFKKPNTILFEDFAEKASVKRYFEYNYNINSIVLFGEVLNKVLNVKTTNYLSKYIVQALHFINKAELTRFSEVGFFRKLDKVKYKENIIKVGSPASIGSIIDFIIRLPIWDIDTITTKNSNTRLIYTKNENFYKLMDILVKHTFDPYLQNRINKWCNMEDKLEAKRLIDTYLIQMFDRQKKKNKYL